METIDITEAQRKQLEQSVEKLRKALKQWHVQSAEYEGLREELLDLPKGAGREQMVCYYMTLEWIVCVGEVWC